MAEARDATQVRGAAGACPDLGLSHVAFSVRDVESSAAFYARYAGLEVVHQPGSRVVWLSDLRRPFALVLIESPGDAATLDGIAHLGIGCESRNRVDELCALAAAEGVLELPAEDAGPPVGYRALLRDPDGNGLELSHGQEVGHAVSARSPAGASAKRGVAKITRSRRGREAAAEENVFANSKRL